MREWLKLSAVLYVAFLAMAAVIVLIMPGADWSRFLDWDCHAWLGGAALVYGAILYGGSRV